jgi:predicted ATP-binding protein involved in virulence
MKLRRLTLINYRGFRGEQAFEFGEEFTVIAGINGRGKSSMLEGLALLLFRFLKAVSLASGTQRSLEQTDITVGGDEVSLEMDIVCGNAPITFSLSRDSATQKPRVRGMNAAVKEHVLNVYGDPTRPDDQAPVAVYYSTDRAGCRLPKKLPRDAPPPSEAAYRDALTAKLVDFRELMHRLRVWRDQGDNRPFDAMRRATEAFLETFGQLQVETDPLQLMVTKGGERFSITQLSDGERSCIAILGDLVRRLTLANPELDDPLLGYGIVLIDELELHLHPQWQLQVVEKLRTLFPNIQFIATTHSPFIVQTLRDGELISLDPPITGDYSGRGLEEVAMSVMGIDNPQVSPRYIAMLDAAKAYFVALQEGSNTSGPQRAALKRKLKKLAGPYADNPAFQAFLELKKAHMLGE